MAIADRLKRFLEKRGIRPDWVRHEPVNNLNDAVRVSGLPVSRTLRSEVMIDAAGPVLVVHGVDTVVDPDAVAALLNRPLRLLGDTQANRLFIDCDPGHRPPVGAAYGLETVVDHRVDQMPEAYLESGRENTLLKLVQEDLELIFEDARRGRIALRDTSADLDSEADSGLTLEEVASRLQKLYRLPPMPALALRILRLTRDPEASASDLAGLIEYDPSLTAQIIRYARSALFQYPGEIHSVQEAVTRVLGFDRVAHMAMGIASAKAFEVPREGMLGMDASWRHSIYCAFLCQQMAARLGQDKGLAYLCGLLHNFGILLIGHLFPEEFRQLSRLREENPEQSMQAIEHQVFGARDEILEVGHGAIGGILHRLWQLPDAVVKCAGVHQQLNYEGEHEDLVHMVQLANELLKGKGIGDEFNPVDWHPIAEKLGLSEDRIEQLVGELDDVAGELDALAQQLAA